MGHLHTIELRHTQLAQGLQNGIHHGISLSLAFQQIGHDGIVDDQRGSWPREKGLCSARPLALKSVQQLRELIATQG